MGFRKTIKLKDGSRVFLRSLSLGHVAALHMMYPAVSPETKLFFHPDIFHPRWLLRLRSYVLLILSSIALCRYALMAILPAAVYLSLVAVNLNGETVAFCYFNLRRKLPGRRFTAVEGVVVRDDYQNRGLGFQFVAESAEFARANGITDVYAEVSTKNPRIIHVIEELGWQKLRLFQTKNPWNGKSYEAYEIILRLGGNARAPNLE
jgi:GNAT superfamily N-acetyltransferase